MTRILIAVFAAFAFTTTALADSKPSKQEAANIEKSLNAWGCKGGDAEKETEATSVYEVDDAKCADGQYDFKLDANFRVISMTRD